MTGSGVFLRSCLALLALVSSRSCLSVFLIVMITVIMIMITVIMKMIMIAVIMKMIMITEISL